MKTFNQFIVEGRDAPLYHSTSIENADQIIRTNRISSSMNLGAMPNISLTRDFRFAEGWRYNDVVFELNQAKLIQTNKIKPYNYFDDKARRRNSSYEKFNFENQSEERAIRDIFPLDRCLTKIILYTSNAIRIVDCYDYLYGHNLLYNWQQKRFINQ